MSTRVVSDQELWQEAVEVIRKNMSPAKAARVISGLRIGSGNYADLKERLFGGETVDSLSAAIMRFQEGSKKKPIRPGKSGVKKKTIRSDVNKLTVRK